MILSPPSLAVPEKTIQSYNLNGDVTGILGMKLFVIPEKNVRDFENLSYKMSMNYDVMFTLTMNNDRDYVYLIAAGKKIDGALILGTNINGATTTIHIGLKVGEAGVSRQDLSKTMLGALALYLVSAGFSDDFIHSSVTNNPDLINKMVDTSQKVEYKSDETVLWIWREKTKENQQILMAQLRLFA
jgi:hypothetical protein